MQKNMNSLIATKRTPEKTDPFAILDELDAEAREDMMMGLRERWTLFQPTVLIVEDQPFSQKLLLGVLARDYNCHIAGSVRHAVKQFIEHTPSVVLIDVMLGDGTGHELAKAIRSIDPDAYLVMVTANNYESDVETAQENNVNGFIIKPYNKKKILRTMKAFKAYKREVRRHGPAS